MKKTFTETDLYEPVKRFLTDLGYKVNGEVKDCDVTAVKNEELLIVELKKSFNLTLLYQAMDRQDLADQVYVAVPRPTKDALHATRQMKKIIQKLELGLMTVALDSPLQHVEVLVFPGERKKIKKPKARQTLFNEIAGRRTDINKGGGNRVKVMTAYRERAIKIACILENTDCLSARELVNTYGCEGDVYSILRRNQYGWFEKTGRGLYALGPKGRQELEQAEFTEVVEYYRNIAKRL